MSNLNIAILTTPVDEVVNDDMMRFVNFDAAIDPRLLIKAGPSHAGNPTNPGAVSTPHHADDVVMNPPAGEHPPSLSHGDGDDMGTRATNSPRLVAAEGQGIGFPQAEPPDLHMEDVVVPPRDSITVDSPSRGDGSSQAQHDDDGMEEEGVPSTDSVLDVPPQTPNDPANEDTIMGDGSRSSTHEGHNENEHNEEPLPLSNSPPPRPKTSGKRLPTDDLGIHQPSTKKQNTQKNHNNEGGRKKTPVEGEQSNILWAEAGDIAADFANILVLDDSSNIEPELCVSDPSEVQIQGKVHITSHL